MDMTGERRIAAPRETVWRALNDAEVLKQAIPGCEEIDKTSDTEFTAKVTAKVGPVKARFGGKVTLSDLDPPNGYKISGEGQGGGAGFAKGGAEARLPTLGGGGAPRKMADGFFDRSAAAVGAPAAPEAVPVPAEEKRPALSPLVWVGALIVIVVLLLLIFGR